MGIIFDFKRYAIHDGPGIRTTVFLKGCPLNCDWCHNPEGKANTSEFMWWKDRCLSCHDCVQACPQEAISFSNDDIFLDPAACNFCNACTDVCHSQALMRVDREMTLNEVMDELEKDRPFFEESGGGVTFSGGEPLMQPDFLLKLLQACKTRGIHTAVDTCGFARFEDLERISPFVDLFLYDLKLIDDEKHIKHTGVSNGRILQNLRKLAQQHANIIVRVPLIPGINDSSADRHALEDFLLSLESIQGVCILPYHKAGIAKAKRLLRDVSPSFQTGPPSTEQVDQLIQSLEKHGFDVQVGG